jgi:hypothetical protein
LRLSFEPLSETYALGAVGEAKEMNALAAAKITYAYFSF